MTNLQQPMSLKLCKPKLPNKLRSKKQQLQIQLQRQQLRQQLLLKRHQPKRPLPRKLQLKPLLQMLLLKQNKPILQQLSLQLKHLSTQESSHRPQRLPIQIVLKEQNSNSLPFKPKWKLTSKLLKTREKNRGKISRCKAIIQQTSSKD